MTAMRLDPANPAGHRIGGWLARAAAPTFAAMALLTALFGGSDICAATPQGWSLGGMMSMYLLMGVFHLPPWLKLAFGERGRVGRAELRHFASRQARA